METAGYKKSNLFWKTFESEVIFLVYEFLLCLNSFPKDTVLTYFNEELNLRCTVMYLTENFSVKLLLCGRRIVVFVMWQL